MLRNIPSILRSRTKRPAVLAASHLVNMPSRQISMKYFMKDAKRAIRKSHIMKSLLPDSILNSFSSRLNYNIEVKMPNLSKEAIEALRINSPEDIDVVVYHHNCMDGTGAQLAAYLRLGDKVQYIPGTFSGKIPDLTDKRVLFVDFVYPANIMVKLLTTCKGIKILDHHLSSANDLKDFPEELKLFDMDRSGTGLAWDYFHPGKPLPALLAYIEDRDIWRYDLPDSKIINLAIQQHRPRLDEIMTLYNQGDEGIQQLRTEGVVIDKTIQSLLNQAARQSAKKKWGATNQVVAVSNSPLLRSDIGNELCKEESTDFAFIYSYNLDSRSYTVSLRSSKTFINNEGETCDRKSWVDVSLIAKSFGGGGHAHAASFQYHGHVDTLFTDIPRPVATTQ